MYALYHIMIFISSTRIPYFSDMALFYVGFDLKMSKAGACGRTSASAWGTSRPPARDLLGTQTA